MQYSNSCLKCSIFLYLKKCYNFIFMRFRKYLLHKKFLYFFFYVFFLKARWPYLNCRTNLWQWWQCIIWTFTCCLAREQRVWWVLAVSGQVPRLWEEEEASEDEQEGGGEVGGAGYPRQLWQGGNLVLLPPPRRPPRPSQQNQLSGNYRNIIRIAVDNWFLYIMFFFYWNCQWGLFALHSDVFYSVWAKI